MSIELRFKEKEREVHQPIHPGVYGSRTMAVFETHKILQFRHAEHGYAMTEWQDVPLVGVDEE